MCLGLQELAGFQRLDLLFCYGRFPLIWMNLMTAVLQHTSSRHPSRPTIPSDGVNWACTTVPHPPAGRRICRHNHRHADARCPHFLPATLYTASIPALHLLTGRLWSTLPPLHAPSAVLPVVYLLPNPPTAHIPPLSRVAS
jgi:hypothetical protein